MNCTNPLTLSIKEVKEKREKNTKFMFLHTTSMNEHLMRIKGICVESTRKNKRENIWSMDNYKHHSDCI